MKKRKSKNNNQIKTRAEPSTWDLFLATDGPDLKAKGYTKLSDNPEIRMGIERIADIISLMTIHLKRNVNGGDIRVKNGLSRKIDISPYKYMTRQLWIHWIVKSLLLNGNTIVMPIYRDGLIDDLMPVPNSNIKFKDKPNMAYSIDINGISYEYDEILHFRINPMDSKPYIGESYKVTLKDVAQNLKQSGHTVNEFLSNRVIPNLIVKVDALTDEVATREGRARVYDKFVSASRSGEPWIIPAGLIEVQQVKPLTLNDIAIKDTIELSRKTVAGILGIPAFLLGVGQFNEIEYNNFIRTRILNIAKAIEQELTSKLLYDPDLHFKFNSRSLYSYSLEALSNIYSSLYTKGLCTGNEVRDILDMSPNENLNDLVILENFIKIDDIGNQKKLNGGG